MSSPSRSANAQRRSNAVRKRRAKQATQRAKRDSAARAKNGGAKPAAEVAKAPASDSSPASTDAQSLASEIDRALADGNIDALAPEALQDLMAALCRIYSAQVEAGREILPVRGRTTVSSTDIMTTASGLLKAANLAVFELGMWQSWTGR